MRLAIFSGSNISTLENNVNEWLNNLKFEEEKPRFEIINILQSECEKSMTISIFFRPTKHHEKYL